MANKIIAITDVQKDKLDLLKNEYIYKTKKHIKWIPFIDVVIKMIEAEINKIPDFKDPVIKVQPESMVGIEESEDPNLSD